jgi:hypothetical protein
VNIQDLLAFGRDKSFDLLLGSVRPILQVLNRRPVLSAATEKRDALGTRQAQVEDAEERREHLLHEQQLAVVWFF